MVQNSEFRSKKSKNELFFVAVDYLFSKRLVKSQTELAEKIGITASAFSRIKSGLNKVSDDTIRKMDDAFGGIFNMAFFRNESEEMLTSGATCRPEPGEPEPIGTSSPQQPASADADFYHKALELNAKVISALRDDIDYYKQMVLDKDGAIQDNAAEIISLQSRLAAATNELERVKATLKAVRENFDTKQTELDRCNQIISTLQRQLDSTQINSPFPLGTAEPGGIKSNLLVTDD